MSSPGVVAESPKEIWRKAFNCFRNEDVECLLGILSDLTGTPVSEIRRKIEMMDKEFALLYLVVVISQWI